MDYNFKKGVYKLNNQSNFDFQLNRIVMWDGGDLDEIKQVGPTIKTSEDWKQKLISLGDKAVAEDRIENAIAYYRMSEFFMYDGDPDKKKYYIKATDMFYDFYQDIFDSGVVKKYEVPYEDITLPVMVCKAKGEEINALTGVRSLTFRLFTDKEDACNHCNCGNVKLTFYTSMEKAGLRRHECDVLMLKMNEKMLTTVPAFLMHAVGKNYYRNMSKEAALRVKNRPKELHPYDWDIERRLLERK